MISVLMSVYKNDNLIFFREAVLSMLEQTVQPEQFVLVCDGPLSDDYFKEIDWASNRFNEVGVDFKLVKLEMNIGLGLALYEGFKHCTEEFILRMDSDDISRLERIEITKKYISKNPNIDVFGTNIEEFDKCIGDLNRFREVPLSRTDIVKYGKKRNPMNHVTVCMRKKAIFNVGGYESVLFHEDYYLWVKIIMSGFNIININHCLVDVRVGNDLIGRRSGLTYLNYEIIFATKCLETGFFNYLELFKYLIPRIILRLLPKFCLNIIYKGLRK
jgi:glycosyltransferase involved in cell wall biosynthesis